MSAPHSVRFHLEAGHGVTAEFICHGTADDDCHLYCPESCESWSLEDDEQGRRIHMTIGEDQDGEPIDVPHLMARSKSCGVLEWFADGMWFESYEGREVAPVDGPISYRWDGDCYLWRLASDPDDTSAVSR